MVSPPAFIAHDNKWPEVSAASQDSRGQMSRRLSNAPFTQCHHTFPHMRGGCSVTSSTLVSAHSFTPGWSCHHSGVWANHEDHDRHETESLALSSPSVRMNMWQKKKKEKKAKKWTLQNPTTTKELWAFRIISFTSLQPCVRLSYQTEVWPTSPP